MLLKSPMLALMTLSAWENFRVAIK
jgi:hypothetical protein